MPDNPDLQPSPPLALEGASTPRQALRLTGDRHAAPPLAATPDTNSAAPARAPLAVSLLRVADGPTGSQPDTEPVSALPFNPPGPGPRRGAQPAIRTHLIAGRVPGAVIYRI